MGGWNPTWWAVWYDTSRALGGIFIFFSNMFKVFLADVHSTTTTIRYTECYFTYLNRCERLKFADDLFCCWSLMCWKLAKNRYTYGVLNIYSYTTYLVPGGFGSWITGIFLAVACCCWCCRCCCCYVLVLFFPCHIHRPTRYIIPTHHTYKVFPMTPIA